jgi:SAM-dependent methyltransferase
MAPDAAATPAAAPVAAAAAARHDDIAAHYDAIPYESRPFQQTHPAQLAGLARLFKLRPKPVGASRVLELGCASGGNLIPLACAWPGLQAVGIELAPLQARLGQRIIADLGLANAQIVCGDIVDAVALVGAQGPFDIIVCHGVFSWVPEAVQQAILRACRELLAPDGLAYISYNVYPGWKLREVLRDIMLQHAGHLADPRQRIDQARAMVRYLCEINADDSVFGKLLHAESELVLKGSDYYIHHEFLELNNRPCYFRDFMRAAAQQQLAYVGEAQFSDMAPQRLREDIARTLGMLAQGNVLALEQYMDLFTNRYFRQTVLAHQGALGPLSRALDPGSFAGLQLLAQCQPLPQTAEAGKAPPADMPPPPAGSRQYQTRQGRVLTAQGLLATGILDLLIEQAPAPLAFEDLVRRVAERHSSVVPQDLQPIAQAVGEQLLQLLVLGGVTVWSEAPPATGSADTAPRAFAAARWYAEHGHTWAPSRYHLAVTTSPIENAVLLLCDGLHGPQQIAQALVPRFEAGEFQARRGDAVVSDRALLETIVGEAVPQVLARLERQGLLA